MARIQFMGYILSEHGIGLEEQILTDILKARAEIRSFLGLVNFSARFISDLATVSEPLQRLTKKNVLFEWERTRRIFVLD